MLVAFKDSNYNEVPKYNMIGHDVTCGKEVYAIQRIDWGQLSAYIMAKILEFFNKPIAPDEKDAYFAYERPQYGLVRSERYNYRDWKNFNEKVEYIVPAEVTFFKLFSEEEDYLKVLEHLAMKYSADFKKKCFQNRDYFSAIPLRTEADVMTHYGFQRKLKAHLLRVLQHAKDLSKYERRNYYGGQQIVVENICGYAVEFCDEFELAKMKYSEVQTARHRIILDEAITEFIMKHNPGVLQTNHVCAPEYIVENGVPINRKWEYERTGSVKHERTWKYEARRRYTDIKGTKGTTTWINNGQMYNKRAIRLRRPRNLKTSVQKRRNPVPLEAVLGEMFRKVKKRRYTPHNPHYSEEICPCGKHRIY